VLAYLTEMGWATLPLCAKSPLPLADKVFQLAEFHEGGIVIGGPLVPIVPVTCSNCGNTILVNAILSGALKADDQKAATSAAASAAKTGTEAK
jgi:hypothetical protein